MRCLLIAPSDLDLSVLTAVLANEAVEVELTSDIAVGAALAEVDPDSFGCCVAIIPRGPHGDASTSMAAIYVEIGVIATRGLPLLVVVQAPGPPSPALAGLRTATSSMGNAEALRLHVSLFLRSVAGASAEHQSRVPAAAANVVPAGYRERLDEVRASPSNVRGLAFERLVTDLVREAGAEVEERPAGWPEAGVDIAAFLPGEE